MKDECITKRKNFRRKPIKHNREINEYRRQLKVERKKVRWERFGRDFLEDKIDCGDIRRSIEQSSDVGYIVWPLIKPLLLGKILYAPATPVSNAIIAKVNPVMTCHV